MSLDVSPVCQLNSRLNYRDGFPRHGSGNPWPLEQDNNFPIITFIKKIHNLLIKAGEATLSNTGKY